MKIDILESQNNLEDNTSIVTSKDTNKKITYESFNFKQEELPQVSIFLHSWGIAIIYCFVLLSFIIVGVTVSTPFHTVSSKCFTLDIFLNQFDKSYFSV